MITQVFRTGLLLSFALVAACGTKEIKKRPHGVPLPAGGSQAPQPETSNDSDTTGTTPQTPEVDAVCAEFQKSLPDTVVQEFIEVPEDWDKPDGRKIKVFFYYNKSAELEVGGTKTPRVNVAFYNGGPGGDSHSSHMILKDKESNKALRFIFIDQRGTGCSSKYPEEQTADLLQRLAFYGSRNIVKDSEAIRKKVLGEDSKWRVFGQSYGALVVHRYVTMFPASLESAYAHGFALGNEPLPLMIERVRAQKLVGEKYLEKYPDDKALIQELRGLFKDDVCFTSGESKLCGAAALDAFYMQLAFTFQWPDIHTYLGQLKKPDGTLNTVFMDAYLKQTVFAGGSSLGGVIIQELEVLPGFITNQDPTGCKRVTEALQKEGLKLEDWIFNECRLQLALMAGEEESTDPLPPFPRDPLTLEDVSKVLTANPSLKLFLYSGQLDAVVPPVIFKKEVETLKDLITYKEFTASGHDGFFSEEPVFENLLQKFSLQDYYTTIP